MTNWLKATIAHKTTWNERLFSLHFQAEIRPFKAGQFCRIGLDIDGARVGRPYSLVNPPGRTPHEIHFNTVPGGPLSPRLARMNEGDTLWVADSTNGFLVLDELPATRELWMLATGTAIGPFISILSDPETLARYDHIILAHSVSHAGDLAYRDLADELCASYGGVLQYLPVVTREQSGGVLHQRFPASILDGSLETAASLPLSAERSHVMLCGNSAMITDTTQVLAERGMRRHRRREPGHISTEKYH